MITLTSLRKTYGTRTILDGIDASFDAGSVVALVGPSGGGKSTLLRCLNGLERFDHGSIRVGEDTLLPGESHAHGRTLAAIRRRLGMVFQQWNLFPHRSALGNVIEGPIHVLGLTKAEAIDRAHPLLERVGLGHRLDAYPSELSGGEQQRVAIARALAMKPDALLLDEPTSALDPERVGEVLAVLRDLAADGLTMLIVTHEIAFARDVAQRVVVLSGGRIVEDGAPSEVLVSPRCEETRAFLGHVKRAS